MHNRIYELTVYPTYAVLSSDGRSTDEKFDGLEPRNASLQALSRAAIFLNKRGEEIVDTLWERRGESAPATMAMSCFVITRLAEEVPPE
jgi:hypothetical protein